VESYEKEREFAAAALRRWNRGKRCEEREEHRENEMRREDETKNRV
jgi:hypothetical protein